MTVPLFVLFDLLEALMDCARVGFSWTLIGDNIDIMTKVKLMSKENKNKFHHFYHLIATESRIS